MISGISGPAFDEAAELLAQNEANPQAQASGSRSVTPKLLEAPVQKQPLSPKSLAPLIIPTSSAPVPRLAQESRGDETPGPDVPPKSARMLEFSPPIKTLAAKPPPMPATIPSSSKQQIRQPNSAPSDRSESQPWSSTPNFTPTQGRSQTPDARYVFGHRRGASEGANNIMDRGRPPKRLDASPSQRLQSAPITESIAEERRAFEALPQSFTPEVASVAMSAAEVRALKEQAIGQAARFGVLSSKDVDSLSKVSYFNHPFLSIIC